MATPPRHFDHGYRETAALKDGTPVLLRLVRPQDKEMLLRGLDRLSPRSRYLRFFTNKSHLSTAELKYLTEVDGESHFALGAVRILPDGSEEGLGIARFVRLADEPEVAEGAIVVVDDYQRRGLGRLLFVRLVAAARERGVQRFRSQVMANNRPMRTIIKHLAPHAREHLDGGVITVDADVPAIDAAAPPESPSARGTHYRLLALAAEDGVKVRPLSGDPFAPSLEADEQSDDQD